jgi:hemerythrin-like domain-containing protein
MASPQPEAYSRSSWEAVVRSMEDRKISKNPVLTTLYAEHRYMATLMKLLADQLDAVEQGEEVESHVLYESLHYMTHFPDAFHHPREDMVYQRAGELNADLADSVDTLQREHDYIAELGSRTLREVERWQAGEIKSSKAIKLSREYIDAIYRHMNVEEKLIFPQIEELLTPEDWRALEQEDLINPVADPVFGPKVSREYRNLARKARRSLRRGVEDATMVEWVGLEALLESYEVIAMALESSRSVAREHFKEAIKETGEILEERDENGGLLMLPFRCAANNTQHTVKFLRDIRGISKDTFTDLSELGRGTRDRIRLVRSDPPSSSRH